MADHMSIWNCPECGGTEFNWSFTAPDGTTLMAKLAVQPDMSSVPAAKEKALAEHAEMVDTYRTTSDA